MAMMKSGEVWVAAEFVNCGLALLGLQTQSQVADLNLNMLVEQRQRIAADPRPAPPALRRLPLSQARERGLTLS
jgi:hypothetical protein